MKAGRGEANAASGPATWRDPEGVVHIVADNAEPPPGVRRVIEHHLATRDWFEAVERAQALSTLIETWEEEATNDAAIHLEVGPACEPDPGGQPPRAVDRGVVRKLRERRDETPLPDRLQLLTAMHRLVREWEGYCLDDEKLLGHLIVHHGGKRKLRRLDGDALLALHAKKHRRN